MWCDVLSSPDGCKVSNKLHHLDSNWLRRPKILYECIWNELSLVGAVETFRRSGLVTGIRYINENKPKKKEVNKNKYKRKRLVVQLLFIIYYSTVSIFVALRLIRCVGRADVIAHTPSWDKAQHHYLNNLFIYFFFLYWLPENEFCLVVCFVLDDSSVAATQRCTHFQHNNS